MGAAGVILIVVLIRCILGGIAAAIASSKGRSVVGWFFGGLFLDIIGIIIVAVLPNLKAEHAYRGRVEYENRRLREQLRQERVKGESFRQYSVNRLDAHDGALGMDTRSLPAGAESAGPPQLDWSVDGSAAAVDPASVLWYYEQRGETKGPVPVRDIHTLLSFNEITPQTLVWCEGMADWAPLQTLPTLSQRPS